MGSGITEALGKVAGAFGVAMTAVEAFNKIIESSDALDDYYKSTMEEVTASVNTFFDALAHGNFRSFITDL
jgi:biopolymer transport protein ExbB/TolQ